MREKSRVLLFKKLGAVAYRTLESAALYCKSRGHAQVDLAHWLQQMFQVDQSDLNLICRHFGIDAAHLAADLTAFLESLPAGAMTVTGFAPKLDEAIRDAVLIAEELEAPDVRSGHLLLACLQSPRLKGELLKVSVEFEGIDPNVLSSTFARITRGSSESTTLTVVSSADGADGSAVPSSEAAGKPGESSRPDLAPAIMGRQQALEKFSIDLTRQAREGTLDPIVGRDGEIRQLIGVLLRRQKNNPILVGEAGVGKTSVVEGFAQRVVAGDVPPALRDISIRVLDIGLLLAGASMKGEFEQRLRQVIEEVQNSPVPIVLFIDEAHTLIGAGGAKGQGDAANLLKPALARGTLRTIAATTHSEYKEYFEQDPALVRRFEVVTVAEPDEKTACIMLRAVARRFEAHHKVLILDEAIESAVRLSRRYMPARQLPDKAVGLLDTACARVAVTQHASPASIDSMRAKLAGLQSELEIVQREAALGMDHAERPAELIRQIDQETLQLRSLEQAWQAERDLVSQILALRTKLDQPRTPDNANRPDDAIGPANRDLSAASADAGWGNEHVDRRSPNSAESATVPHEGSPSQESRLADDSSGNGIASVPEQPGEALRHQLRDLQTQLKVLQGDRPLVLPSVDAQAVAEVISDYTGIPVGRMVKNEIEAVLNLADTLSKRVIGQRHALHAIATQLLNSRVPGLDNTSKPIGVFLLAGPSGVGKTETALALAEAIYGGEQNLITINMSEFQEAHTVALLKGAPPGYVGYGKGGILTEAVRRKPYSVVLLDEVEKAHPDVHEIFFQVFDKGRMDDAEGRQIDFKNTIILLTSNVGSDLILEAYCDPATEPDMEQLNKALRQSLRQVFPDALLGRLQIVPYKPILPDMLDTIIRLQLDRIAQRVQEQQKIPFQYADDVVRLIASRCTEPESGARKVGSILSQVMVPSISREYLVRLAAGKVLSKVELGVKDEQFTYSFD